MAKKTGKSQIDVKTLLKKLKKRRTLDTKALPRDRKLLEHLVFALLLEEYSLANARSAFAELQRYFIDWNEIRVARAYEIAEVITDDPDTKATTVGERLRRILQWIFDEKYKFDLEEYRAKGVGALLEFLESVPYCTRFMREYVAVFAFGENGVPLDENSLRALRLLGAVSVADGKEVATCLNILKDSDATDFFFALHELGVELADPKTRGAARKFLRAFDSEIDNRSESPLVESSVPTDPRDIAKMCMMNRRAQRPTMPSVDDVDDFGDVDDEKGEEDDIERMISAAQNDGTPEEAPAERPAKRGRKSNASSSAAVEIGVSRDGMTYVKNETAETATPPVKKTRAAQKSPVEEKSVKSAAPDDTKRVKGKKRGAEETAKTLSLLEEPEVAPSKPAKSASRPARAAKNADAKVEKAEKAAADKAAKAAKKETKPDASVKAPKSKKAASPEEKATADEAASVRPAKRRIKTVEPEPTPKKAAKAVEVKSAKADAPKTAVKRESRAKVKESAEAAKKVTKSAKEAVKETKKDAKSTKTADAAPKSKVARTLKKIAETVVPGKTSKKSRKETDSAPKSEKGKSVTKTRKPSSEPPDSSSSADVGKKAGKRSSKRK